MRNHLPFGVRPAVVLLISTILALVGCKTSGSSTESPAGVYYDSRTETLIDSAPSRDSKTPIIHLQWMAPATRADGSKLYAGEIGGYRIYFKLRHQDAFRTIEINDASMTRYPLEGFSPGVYEFAVSTLDVEGLESQRSKTVSVNII